MSRPAPELRDDWHVPLDGRLPPPGTTRDAILAAHAAALDLGASTYVDPHSRLMVFTASFLARRGYCCDSGCRHCPYAVADDDSR